MKTKSDKRAENLAIWLREKGYECRVTPEDFQQDAAVFVEKSTWHFNLSDDTGYFPVQRVGSKLRFCPRLRSRPQVLELLGTE